MTHYRSNLGDLRFNLFELLGLADSLDRYELDADVVNDMLTEVERLAVGPVAASFVESDRNPPVYDPKTFSVTMPEAFKRSYKAWMDAEWWRLDMPVEAGGTKAPRALWWALIELIQGAHAPVFMFGGGPGMAGLLYRMGTEDQKRIADIMIERRWGATMVLTEPDAGSDVGAGRTTARQQADGSWHIEGVKRFITSAEHDLEENIVHLVLARPEGAGPGTKGLSLFIVPKFRFDRETGEIKERNGVYTTNVEKKMGIKVSTTCELTFGASEPAVGWLVGDVHEGIAQMFKVIEFARMQVGVKAIAALSTGYLNALEYAKSRVQGPDMTTMFDKASPRVTIDKHPDVRRMLMLQKAYAEGLRSTYLYTAHVLDEGDAAMNDLLLPIVKGVGSERSYEMLTLSLQTLGGSGFLQDYPIEQYIRDTKIDTLYEGTTGIQGQDFFFRKVARDDAAVLNKLFDEIAKVEEMQGPLAEVKSMVDTMLSWNKAAKASPDEIYKVGQNATRLLMSVGDLVIGWLLWRSAKIAEHKVDVAKFFAANVLPELSMRREILEATDNSLMEADL